MILWNIRSQGAPTATEGVTAEDIVNGVKEGVWDPSDEIMGPNDPDWVPLEQHPVFEQAMADYDPPPPPHPEDETRLDMNPLIDVALVLLIFFMLTTTYEELRKEFNPPPGQRQDIKGIKTDAQIKSVAVRVHASLNGEDTVYTVENEVVPASELEAKFKEYIEQLGHRKLAMEVDARVPWKAEVVIYDAAAGAKFDEIIRVIRPPKEE
jgi:biopolymer transport protein ExbD